MLERYDKMDVEVIQQGRLAAHWYAEARNAMDRGDLATAIEMQQRAAFRSMCARAATQAFREKAR